MQALAAAGAYIELAYILLDMGSVSGEETARTFRAVGADRIVLTTDVGQVDREAPAEALAHFAAALADEGIGLDEIGMAMKTNPWRLVGDDPA
jgi:electron transfer flavoprotein alpha/beta subunit